MRDISLLYSAEDYDKHVHESCTKCSIITTDDLL